MWGLEDSFIDSEDLVAKIQQLQAITLADPFKGWHGESTNFFQKIDFALSAIPKKYLDAAVALFANVVYLTDPILNEAWREISFLLEQDLGWDPKNGFDDAFILGIDNGGLVNDIGNLIGITGREDHDKNPGYDTVSNFIGKLSELVKSDFSDRSIIKDLITIQRKKFWLLFTDNVYSGGSAKSDLEKLNSIRKLLFSSSCHKPQENVPEIILCAQVITEQAMAELKDTIPSNLIYYGLKFDNRFRINSDSCALFHDHDTLLEVRDLCNWFGNTVFIDKLEPEFSARLEANRNKGGQKNYAFGWRDSGYSIVAKSNSPSNSPAIIHYTPINPIESEKGSVYYKPPFPRTESRISHVVSNDRAILTLLQSPEYKEKFNKFAE